MCSARTPRASGREPGVRDEHVRLLEPAIRLRPSHAPLRVVGDDDDALGGGEVRLVGLALEQVRGREAGVDAHAVDAEEEHVDVEGAQRRDRDGSDQRVGRRAHASRSESP